jgi:hypothetical protein
MVLFAWRKLVATLGIHCRCRDPDRLLFSRAGSRPQIGMMFHTLSTRCCRSALSCCETRYEGKASKPRSQSLDIPPSSIRPLCPASAFISGILFDHCWQEPRFDLCWTCAYCGGFAAWDAALPLLELAPACLCRRAILQPLRLE